MKVLQFMKSLVSQLGRIALRRPSCLDEETLGGCKVSPVYPWPPPPREKT